MTGSTGSPDLSGEQRTSPRIRLLEAAAEMVGEHLPDAAHKRPFGALHLLRLRSVAAAAGKTVGSITASWGTKQDFLTALAEFMLDPERLGTSPVECGDLSDDRAIERIAVDDFAELRSSRAFFFALSLWPSSTEPGVDRILRRFYEARVASFERFLDEMHDRVGLVPRYGLTMRDVATALVALEEGLVLHTVFAERRPCSSGLHEECRATTRPEEVFAFGVRALIGSLCDRTVDREGTSIR